MKKYQLPTGFLFTDEYSKGQLETLSIGDYGKHHNVKADFLGITRELNGVENVPCLPLSDKWVITLSTQYGCPMKCNFCACPNVKFGGNTSFEDLKKQFFSAIGLFPDVSYTDRLNIHFARMGEPIFTESVFEFSRWIAKRETKREIQNKFGLRLETIHPVLTTSMPKNYKFLFTKLEQWAFIKNNMFNGQAGLQISINSTNDEQRDRMFGGSSSSLEKISEICSMLAEPIGRKYCLNFALASGNELDAVKLAKLFDPENFMVKITPIHNNNECRKNGIETIGGYNSFAPYKQAEKDLIAAGFDVLIFVPSMDEEDGLVTCGNAVLGGSEFKINVI